MVPLNKDQGIQSDTPSAIPRGVLRQRGGEVRDEHGAFHAHFLTASTSSVWTRTRLRHPYGVRCAVTLPRVITQLTQVKLRLPKLDINGCFDRRAEFRFSKGNAERVQQRADDGA
jgi:hypothetical protein